MSVLVTGGTGLIGRHIVRELVNRGCGVVSYDSAALEEQPAGVDTIIGDIRDGQMLAAEFRERSIQRMIHCAAMLQATCEEQPADAVAINAGGTANVLEAAREAGVKRVVLASSIAVYGRSRYSPMDEAHPCEPTGVYGAAKLLNEQLAKAYERQSNMEVLTVRFGLVYGPGGVRSKGVAAAFRDMLRGAARERRVRIPPTQQIVPLTYVTDAAVGAVLACLKTPTPLHRIYNISGHGCTLEVLAQFLCKLYPGTTIERNDDRLVSPLNGHLDFTLATKELGYAPEVSFEEGVMRTCAHLMKNQVREEIH